MARSGPVDPPQPDKPSPSAAVAPIDGEPGGSRVAGKVPLDVLKALGDNTRYAIYLELARSPLPLTTAEVADVLELHVNTVRPHLERMREVGLLQVDTDRRGAVGRPQHRYALSDDAPSLGLEPSPWPTLARLLVQAAAEAGLDAADVSAAGTQQGRDDADRWPPGTDGLEALIVEQARLGFDPEVVDEPGAATMAFAHCPFRSLAEVQPELICGLHCSLVEGVVDAFDDTSVARFHTIVDRSPCQVELSRA